MSPEVIAAVRTRARAEVRCEVALQEYRDARRRLAYRHWLKGGTDENARRYRSFFMDAYAMRMRWSTLASLLAADAVETTVAA